MSQMGNFQEGSRILLMHIDGAEYDLFKKRLNDFNVFDLMIIEIRESLLGEAKSKEIVGLLEMNYNMIDGCVKNYVLRKNGKC